MICCKIIADYNNTQGSFDKLCELLGEKGDWFWCNDTMYFADTEGSTEEKHVVRAIKKAGYTKYFIDVYDEKNEPREGEEAYSWIADKVAKITYKNFMVQNEKVLLQTKEGLDVLEKELDGLIADAMKKLENKQSDTTEDSN